MIAKVPARRNDGRSSFASLAQYLAVERLDRDTGEVQRRPGAHLETNCLSIETAAAEMRAVADMNARVHDPVYHCVISWPTGEQPTDKQMIDAAIAAQASIGMDGHQYLYAVHRDTANAHVHMMINRVNPTTHKAAYPKRDFFVLDKCMRELELAQGWSHDAGPYEVIDGKVVRASRREPRLTAPLPTRARDFEAATGCESLLSYAQQCSDEFIAALDGGGWQGLHAALRKHGLEIREAGQGFKIFDIADPSATPVKASDVADALGGGKLRNRLGDFVPPLRVILAEPPERTYNPYRAKQRAGRNERSEARAAARLELRNRYDSDKRECVGRQQEMRLAEQLELRALAARTRAERQRIRSQVQTPEVRQAELSILAMQSAAARERIKKEGVAKREAAKPKSYRDWCGEQAEQGNEAAIAQLKGWEYQTKRRRQAAEAEEEEVARRGAISAELADRAPAAPQLILDGIGWRVDKRSGDVTYRLGARDALRDTGRLIAVLQQDDDKSIEAGLRLAAQKFGSTLILTGPIEFRQRAAKVAVEQGLGLRFADPEIEAYRAALEKSVRKAKTMESKNAEQSHTRHRPNLHPGQPGQGQDR